MSSEYFRSVDLLQTERFMTMQANNNKLLLEKMYENTS